MANPDTNSSITTIHVTIARADLSRELGIAVADDVADDVADAVADTIGGLYPEAVIEVNVSSSGLETRIHAMADGDCIYKGDWVYICLRGEVEGAIMASLEASLEAS